MMIDLQERPTTRFEAPPFTVTAPNLVRFFDYWHAIGRGRAVPLRRDFDPIAVSFMLGYIMLIEVRERPRHYFVRVHGTEIARRVGFELTGKTIDQLPVPEYRDPAVERFDTVVRTGLPHHTLTEAAGETRTLRYEALLLPLSRQGETVDMLLAGLHFYTANELTTLSEKASPR